MDLGPLVEKKLNVPYDDGEEEEEKRTVKRVAAFKRTPVNNANLIICDYHCDDINCHHIEIGNMLLNPISCI